MDRHQLVRLTPEAWRRLIAGAGVEDAFASAGLAHWADHSLPLVVARRSPGAPPSSHALGLPLPTCWGRRRLRVEVPTGHLAGTAGFPSLSALVERLEPPMGAALLCLSGDLDALGLHARVFGSHGWQAITGLDYVHAGSDLDLLLPVRCAHTADAACSLLDRFSLQTPRLDGELVFPDGTAVAWREWLAWRSAGQVGQILLKRVDGVALATGDQWLACATSERSSP